MSAAVRPSRSRHGWRHLRVLRTPKGLLLMGLGLMLLVAARYESMTQAWPAIADSLMVATAIDAPLARWRRGRWELPTGAWLTAGLVSLVLSPYETYTVAPWTTAIAVASKHVVRARGRHVFNPAAVGLVASFHVFHAAHTWWGALAEAPPALGWTLLLAVGAFMADRVHRVPLVLSFLAVYFAAFTSTAFASDAARVAEVFQTPDVQAACFFGCFFLTDPPTSPASGRDQIACGALVAAAGYALFVTVGAAYYLLGGVLVGNAFVALRRRRRAALPGCRGPRVLETRRSAPASARASRVEARDSRPIGV